VTGNSFKLLRFLACLAILAIPASTVLSAQSKGRNELREYIRAGVQARQEHRLEDAAREFEAAAKLAPDQAEIHASLGLTRHHQGNLTAAVTSFARALELKPALPGVHALLGFDLLTLGRVKEAIGHLEQARQEAPSNLDVTAWLGVAYLRTERPGDAVELLEVVQRSRPEDIDTLLYLEQAYAAVSNEAGQRQMRRRIAELDPTRTVSDSASEATPKPGGHREPAIREACTQCHRWSPPATLPQDAWLGAVAKMYGLANEGGLLASAGRPIEGLELAEIAAYFEMLSPEKLETPPWQVSPQTPAISFERRALLGVPPGDKLPGASNLRLLELFDDVDGPELVVCDMLSGWVAWTDPDDPEARLEGLAKLAHPDHVEAADLDGDGRTDLLVAELGAVMPSDKTEGAIVWLRALGERRFEAVPLASNLGRVADVQAADFDGDGDLDIVAAVFGWISVGRIVYLENLGESSVGEPPKFRPTTIDERAGAIHVPVVDLNKDGKPDFLALISQHHETVVAFLNLGAGRFEKREVFAAPHPHWGSSGIEITDLDGDGDVDVLFTNGDTMDDMLQFKPYQGLAWLENRGGYPFVHHAIDRYYGAMRAETGDLDGDGDLDIAASSWIPELDEEERKAMNLPGVVWYEQTVPGSFEAHVLSDDPADHPTLEVGDVDGDGRPEVIVGTAWLGEAPSGRPPVSVEIWRRQVTPELLP